MKTALAFSSAFTGATEPTLSSKVEALQSLLLNDPRPDDSVWSEQLIIALEQVADYALNPDVPTRALSRTLRASGGVQS
jgi:hypothetical protein